MNVLKALRCKVAEKLHGHLIRSKRMTKLSKRKIEVKGQGICQDNYGLIPSNSGRKGERQNA